MTLIGLIAASIALSTPSAKHPNRDYPVQPVPFTNVHLTDKFWAPQIDTNRTVSLPEAFQKCEETGRIRNFVEAAQTLAGQDPSGKPLPNYPFDDSDLYKVIEGASYSLAVHPDSNLEVYIDGIIGTIGKAQEPDGYLYTARTINPEHPHEWSGPERWVNEEEQSHELYDCGHLYQGAVAFYEATGHRKFLDIAIKNADLLCRTFGPGKRKIWPGHEVVEMGLAELYRVTHAQKYLDLAKFLIDSRGGAGEYWQANEPVVDQRKAVGHAVRAGYLYSGVADVAAMTGDEAYIHAIDSIWQDVVGAKLYITGGVGATSSNEGFGPDYFLPNQSAYCETCAAVANCFWNYRLFLLHGDASYVDVFERTLYNGLISGVSLKGGTYFYPNPLESRGGYERSPWFGVPCCPGNIVRFMPSVPGYFYAVQGNSLFVNLYATGTATVQLGSGRSVIADQQTNYPWDGRIRITLHPRKRGAFYIKLRIPGWARNEPVPSDLYTFEGPVPAPPTLEVNGKPVVLTLDHGYAVLDRSWKEGDRIDLNIPMPVRKIVANSKVKADIGRMALQRGPIVYCAEGADYVGGKVRNLMLPLDSTIRVQHEPKLLDGVTVLTSMAYSLSKDQQGNIVERKAAFTAIPYYAWDNRGPNSMLVWLPYDQSHVTPSPFPTLTSTAEVTSSRGTNRYAINDPHDPVSSYDQSEFFHWWPKKGTTEWVEYTFPNETTVSRADLYWFDDTGYGECRVPKAWRLFYKEGDAWKPVQTRDLFGVDKDRYNTIRFVPIRTVQLRLEVDLQEGWSAGIQQWTVER